MKTKKTILFLEDEQELLNTVSLLLTDQGYDVCSATSAEEALSQMNNPRIFDLILADIKLPGIDGFDFYRNVRTMPQYRSTPFVYLTAFNNLQAAVQAKKQGAAEYITKPFDFEYLITRVKDLLPP